MVSTSILTPKRLSEHLSNFVYREKEDLFADGQKTRIENRQIEDREVVRFVNEFWTSKQRQSSSIHEISYRACFKSQLPRFFIQLVTRPGDTVYDPFNGRGTTIIEAGLLGRRAIGNDINPLSRVLTLPRFQIPDIHEIEDRLERIHVAKTIKSDIDLSMFYHPKTLAEVLSLRKYLHNQHRKEKEDCVDQWIRMVATNRLTGHSKGFFSVYSLPPNQAISPEKQRKINELRKQQPDYRDTRLLIIRKTKSLVCDLTDKERDLLKMAGNTVQFFTEDARNTSAIASNSVQLTVTSPPFLDVVQYAQDNWLRCWFNHIDAEEVERGITMSKKVSDWASVMQQVFHELYRITTPGGYVAFEVGEVRGGKIKLEEYVIPLGIRAGFECVGVMINTQDFTKTANIWGISNNLKGTNTNRIAIFNKR